MDPRWLEILKASGWQLFGLSLGLFGLWMLMWFGVLPFPDNAWVRFGLPLATLVVGGLSLAAGMEASLKALRPHISKRATERHVRLLHEAEKKRFSEYKPHLTEIEWKILAYLYQNNQKVFTAPIYGDLASTLYNQRFVKLLAPPGQKVSIIEATFEVSEPVWEVIQEDPERFASPKVGTYRGRPPWFSP